jgi:DNA-directed RNA polymerase beta' subunit
MTDEDCYSLGLDPKWARPEWMINSVLPVPPTHVRPPIEMGGARCQDDLTHKLSDIIKANLAVGSAIRKGEPDLIVNQFVALLQYHCATFVDNQVCTT